MPDVMEHPVAAYYKDIIFMCEFDLKLKFAHQPDPCP